MKKLLLILLLAFVGILIWDLVLIYHSNAVYTPPSQIEQDTTPIVPLPEELQ